MYGLRCINNMYSEHAGKRSDFIIVGHPEFQMGKVHSSTRHFPAWDMRPVPSKPGKCMASNRSKPVLVRQLSAPGPVGSLKQRALEHSSKPEVPSASPRGSLVGDYFAFEQALHDMARHEQEAKYSREQVMRTAASYACRNGHSATCRNFATLHRELDDLRMKLEDEPEKTRESLRATNSWRYYAKHLEQAKQLESDLRRQRQQMAPTVQALHKTM
mmetsp:Transcript_119725/g.284430  ORF Transcript_119725/g.284430 Transcript_119725/m.284430 type:complete len:216 (-) Transcript_119725:35-682(-)